MTSTDFSRINYSVGNRNAAVRIPGYIKDPNVIRIEFRPADGTANIYLAFAAMLAAGLDGVEKKIDPGPPLEDITDLSEAEAKSHPYLPYSLARAFEALEDDKEFLLKDGVFSPELMKTWTMIKRDEMEQVKIRPHPWEFRLYYDA